MIFYFGIDGVNILLDFDCFLNCRNDLGGCRYRFNCAEFSIVRKSSVVGALASIYPTTCCFPSP
jgi:hypothetical protein